MLYKPRRILYDDQHLRRSSPLLLPREGVDLIALLVDESNNHLGCSEVERHKAPMIAEVVDLHAPVVEHARGPVIPVVKATPAAAADDVIDGRRRGGGVGADVLEVVIVAGDVDVDAVLFQHRQDLTTGTEREREKERERERERERDDRAMG